MTNPYQRLIDLAEDRIRLFRTGMMETWDIYPRRETTRESIAFEVETIRRLRPAVALWTQHFT